MVGFHFFFSPNLLCDSSPCPSMLEQSILSPYSAVNHGSGVKGEALGVWQRRGAVREQRCPSSPVTDGAVRCCPGPTPPAVTAPAGFTVLSCRFPCFWLKFEAFTFLSSPSCCGVMVAAGRELVMLLQTTAPRPAAPRHASPGFVF